MPVDWGNNVDAASSVEISARYQPLVDASASTLAISARYQLVFDAAVGIRFSSIVITTTTLAAGTGDVAYSENITARGGSAAGYVWTVVTGSLPPGLTLASPNTPTTTLSGTPTLAGSYIFTVRVTDSNGSTDDQEFLIVIGAAPTVLAGYSDTLRGGRRLAIIDSALAFASRNDAFLSPVLSTAWTPTLTTSVVTPTSAGLLVSASATASSSALITQAVTAAYGDAQVTLDHLLPDVPPASATDLGIEWFNGTNAVSLVIDFVNGERRAVLRTRAGATVTLLASIECQASVKLRIIKAVSGIHAYVDGTFLARTGFLGTTAGNLRLVARSNTASVEVAGLFYDFVLQGGVAIDGQSALVPLVSPDSSYMEFVVPATTPARLGVRSIEAYTPTTGVYSPTGFTYTVPFERLYLSRRGGGKPSSSVYGRRSLKS
jgi:hypothetical protein